MKKSFKLIVSLALCFVISLSVCIPVFAQGSVFDYWISGTGRNFTPNSTNSYFYFWNDSNRGTARIDSGELVNGNNLAGSAGFFFSFDVQPFKILKAGSHFSCSVDSDLLMWLSGYEQTIRFNSSTLSQILNITALRVSSDSPTYCLKTDYLTTGDVVPVNIESVLFIPDTEHPTGKFLVDCYTDYDIYSLNFEFDLPQKYYLNSWFGWSRGNDSYAYSVDSLHSYSSCYVSVSSIEKIPGVVDRPDTGAYDNTASDLDGVISAGKDSVNTMFTQFSLKDFATGLLGWQKILTAIIDGHPWLYQLLYVSLVFGLVGLLFGLSPVFRGVGRMIRRREDEKNRQIAEARSKADKASKFNKKGD